MVHTEATSACRDRSLAFDIHNVRYGRCRSDVGRINWKNAGAFTAAGPFRLAGSEWTETSAQTSGCCAKAASSKDTPRILLHGTRAHRFGSMALWSNLPLAVEFCFVRNQASIRLASAAGRCAITRPSATCTARRSFSNKICLSSCFSRHAPVRSLGKCRMVGHWSTKSRRQNNG